MIQSDEKELETVIGLVVSGLVSYSYEQKLVVLFENTASITFLDSPMFIDSGIIGGTIRTAKKYSGEMGFVISFREMKINSEAYQYCYLNVSEEYSFSQKNRLRIAYKDLRVEMPHSS